MSTDRFPWPSLTTALKLLAISLRLLAPTRARAGSGILPAPGEAFSPNRGTSTKTVAALDRQGDRHPAVQDRFSSTTGRRMSLARVRFGARGPLADLFAGPAGAATLALGLFARAAAIPLRDDQIDLEHSRGPPE